MPWPAFVVRGQPSSRRRDDPAPGLSPRRGLATLDPGRGLVLAILTIRRRYGPWALARALAEYAVVVLLAVLVATTGRPPSTRPAARPPAGRRRR